MQDNEQTAAPELIAITNQLKVLDPTGDRFAVVIRDTIDQLLDGRRTGRWDYQQLYKTEKTHLGTLLEINLQKEFKFDDGDVTDYRIASVEVDCKFSQRVGGWELGPEMEGQYLLVLWASDEKSLWKAGLVKADRVLMRETTNRDAKRRLTEEGVQRILWLWPDNSTLAPNQLLHLAEDKRERIMNAVGFRGQKSSIQSRVNQLFREVQNTIIRRTTLETVGYGADDPMKRARGNGGARDFLRPEGITVLGHQENDPIVAQALGLPKPRKGEFIATRLVPVPSSTTERPAAEIENRYYAVALEGETVPPAPIIPKKLSIDSTV